MNTVILTDGKYRAAIAAARTFFRGGWQVIAVQTRDDSRTEPPVFASRCVAETRWIPGSVKDASYAARLLELVREYDRPVVFPVGADTLRTLSAKRAEFAPWCDFLVPDPEVLEAVNDKARVHGRAKELGIPVPAQFSGTPDRYPVIIKPRCGEQYGLKAGSRYAFARNEAEFSAALASMTRYDPQPVVQELVDGPGAGVCLLIDQNGRVVGRFGHRRIREYPITGGPSSCCESVYEPGRGEMAARLLGSFGFAGMAMVEFKGDCLLEVNPRVWGSFPLTELAESPFALRYAMAARGEDLDDPGCDYKTGKRMRFLLNDTLATARLLTSGQFRAGMRGVADMFRVPDALTDRRDPGPKRKYLKNTLLGRSHGNQA